MHGVGYLVQGIDAMDDDTLGKVQLDFMTCVSTQNLGVQYIQARKAAKAHLYALRDHVEQAMEASTDPRANVFGWEKSRCCQAFQRLEGVVFMAAETVKAWATTRGL